MNDVTQLKTKAILALIEQATGKTFKPKDKNTAIKLYQRFCPAPAKQVEIPAAVKQEAKLRESRFAAKTMTLTYDPTNGEQRVTLESHPRQARILVSLWLAAKQETLTGAQLAAICEASPEFLGKRSAQLVIQRYVTYLTRDGLMSTKLAKSKLKTMGAGA